MASICLEEYDLLGDSKYRSYVSAVDKALKNFEYTSEWADLISALAKLNKVRRSTEPCFGTPLNTSLSLFSFAGAIGSHALPCHPEASDDQQAACPMHAPRLTSRSAPEGNRDVRHYLQMHRFACFSFSQITATYVMKILKTVKRCLKWKI